MSYQRLNYLTSIEIEGEVYSIFLDQNFRFVYIHADDPMELSNGIMNVTWGIYNTFDSYESLVDYINAQAARTEEEYEPTDPENTHWENVATWNERFSYD